MAKHQVTSISFSSDDDSSAGVLTLAPTAFSMTRGGLSASYLLSQAAPLRTGLIEILGQNMDDGVLDDGKTILITGDRLTLDKVTGTITISHGGSSVNYNLDAAQGLADSLQQMFNL